MSMLTFQLSNPGFEDERLAADRTHYGDGRETLQDRLRSSTAGLGNRRISCAAKLDHQDLVVDGVRLPRECSVVLIEGAETPAERIGVLLYRPGFEDVDGDQCGPIYEARVVLDPTSFRLLVHGFDGLENMWLSIETQLFGGALDLDWDEETVLWDTTKGQDVPIEKYWFGRRQPSRRDPHAGTQILVGHLTQIDERLEQLTAEIIAGREAAGSDVRKLTAIVTALLAFLVLSAIF
jgi:hypothetical protein